jgi:hypothetical protein
MLNVSDSAELSMSKPTRVWWFIGGFFLHFAIMYPGFMTYDAVNQILEARAGVFSDWHPPLMAMIWRLLEHLMPGPAPMLFLQLGLIWLGAFLVFHAFFQSCSSKIAASLLCGLFFLPPMFGVSGAILKDMLMWGALLTAFGVAGHINSTTNQELWLTGVLSILTLLLLWLAILLRHNAIFATIPLLGFAIFRLFPKDNLWGLIRAIIPAAIIAALLFAASGAINKQFADRHTQPWVANAAFDIVGILKRMEDKTAQQTLFAQLAQSLNSSGTVEPVLQAYTPMYWREVFRSKPPTLLLPENSIGPVIHGFESFSAEQLSALHQLWTQSIIAEPLLWLRHRFAVSKYVLGWVPESSWSPVIMGMDFPLDLAKDYGSIQVSTALQNKLETVLYSLIDYWFFQPWPYFLVSIIILAVMFFRPINANIEITCLISSGLLHEIGLLLAAPSPDFRYSHYMVFCALLSLLLLARPWLKKIKSAP